MAVKSIMIVGVGGQGTLLASRIIGNALIDCGYDVKVSEVHGMLSPMSVTAIKSIPRLLKKAERTLLCPLSFWKPCAGFLI